MRLWVCCGHGAGDSGAVGHGYTEAERVRALGSRIKELGGDGVVLMDQSRNWYADHGFDTVQVPQGDAVVELHMDSGAAGARGGHVIYKAGLSPDAYDRALADAISGIFPGRAQTLVGRSNLRNCNVCASRGINYRLVEHGFISDAGDVATFNARIDEIARAYLTIFGIAHTAPEVPKEDTDMTDAQEEMLRKVYDQTFSTFDPSGRDVEMNDHDHIKFIAAKQAKMDEKLDAIIEALEGFVPAVTE